jgi:hypothetical protein
MKKVFDHLPNWTFDLSEVSAGVYQVVATHVTGCSILAKGTELDKLIARATADAQRIGIDVARKKRP